LNSYETRRNTGLQQDAKTHGDTITLLGRCAVWADRTAVCWHVRIVQQ